MALCSLGFHPRLVTFPQKQVGAPRALSSASASSGPKTGVIGEERFKEDAIPGTYWSASTDILGDTVTVKFNTGGTNELVSARVGENLLRVAERCGVLKPDLNFCFEGTCCHCELDVVGGAKEVGYRADSTETSLIRSCICPVPAGRELVEVNVISDEDVWGDGVV